MSTATLNGTSPRSTPAPAAVRTALLYTHGGKGHVATLGQDQTPSVKQFASPTKAQSYAAILEQQGYLLVGGPSALALAQEHGLLPAINPPEPEVAVQPSLPLENTSPEPTAEPDVAQANAQAEAERAEQREAHTKVELPAPEVQAEQTKADKQAITAERKVAQEKAEKAMLKSFKALVGRYAKRDEQQRTWLVDRGEEFYNAVRPAVAAGVKWADAMARLTTMLMAELGSDMTEDLARSMQTYTAATYFGRQDFVTLPTRAQKSLASLFDRSKDDAGVVIYTLAKLSKEDGAKLFRWVMGEDKDTLPLDKPRFTTSGTLAGEDADLLTQALKRQAKEAAEKAQTTVAQTNVASSPAATTTVAAAVEDKKAKGSKGKGPNAGAKSEAAIVGQKPAVAAAALVATLSEYERGDVIEMLAQAGKAPEITTPMIDALVMGIADRGDMELMLHLASVVELEMTLLDKRIELGGAKDWHTVTRDQAKQAVLAAGGHLINVA